MVDSSQPDDRPHSSGHLKEPKRPASSETPLERLCTPKSPTMDYLPPQACRRHATLEIDDYFTGPRDMARHSRWPIVMQLHGSIMPKLILPLLIMSAWASAVVIISVKVHELGVNSVLLTATGFVVSLSLSFRCATAYERYAEGRKYWAALVLSCQSLGRTFWIHVKDVESIDAKETVTRKLNAMNLLVAFVVALKHDLRFEPYSGWPDLKPLIGHLETFAKAATEADPVAAATICNGSRRRGFFRGVGEYLGVSFAASNPRKAIKKATKPLGNLPLEILSHLALTIDFFITKEQLRVPIHQTTAFNALQALNDAMTGTERVLCTPLPIAYSIAITQTAYLFLFLLPFQMVKLLSWVAIPATIAASYIILSVLMIGQEVENPFGSDVNDLPLDSFCEQVAADLDIIASFDTRDPQRFLDKCQLHAAVARELGPR